MNQITNVIKMYFKDKWSFFIIPWAILFFSFAINIIVGVLTGGKTAIYTGGISTIYIYMLVTGMVVLVQSFPFALGMSVRRTDFFLGTAATFVILSAKIAIVLFLLSLVEQWTGAWGVNLHFFYLPYLNNGSAIEQLLVSFILVLNMCFLGFAITSVYRRFGGYGMLIFFGVVILIVSVGAFLCTYYDWWLDMFHWFASHTAFTLVMWTIPLVIVYVFGSYVMLRKATV